MNRVGWSSGNKLTPDQQIALDGIMEYIQRPIEGYKDCSIILYAAAGCGKTFLTRFISDKLRGMYTIAGVAPTHKARKVLDRFLNDGSFYSIKTMTVASLLNKLRSHSYIGTKNYKGSGSKMQLYDVFIIDEASMITDNDIKKIITYGFEHRKKIIFVGDKYQIPNPTQQYICEDGVAYKADSCVFNISGFELTTNLRQEEQNPIIPIYWEFRSAIAEKREPVIDRVDNMIGDVGIKFYTDINEWYKQYNILISDPSGMSGNNTLVQNQNMVEPHDIRIIAYTNDAVKSHNHRVRNLMGRGIKPEVGELLMGYNNVGFPEPYVSNGQDYYIIGITETITKRIMNYTNLVGFIIKTKECDTNIEASLFVPDINSKNNQDILQELVKRAEKVNSSYSSKTDYKKYCDIRNKLIFMENIYKFKNEIVGESQFRNNNPLLFRNINEVINDNQIIHSKLSSDIQEIYGNILYDRINDNKMFSDVEKLCDKYCIIEKDISYGYCLTSHRSQGSTYKIAFVDEADFDKLRDHYNYKLGCDVKTVKEKNQLKYVSFTRPSISAYVLYRD